MAHLLGMTHSSSKWHSGHIWTVCHFFKGELELYEMRFAIFFRFNSSPKFCLFFEQLAVPSWIIEPWFPHVMILMSQIYRIKTFYFELHSLLQWYHHCFAGVVCGEWKQYHSLLFIFWSCSIYAKEERKKAFQLKLMSNCNHIIIPFSSNVSVIPLHIVFKATDCKNE